MKEKLYQALWKILELRLLVSHGRDHIRIQSFSSTTILLCVSSFPCSCTLSDTSIYIKLHSRRGHSIFHKIVGVLKDS